MTNRSLGHRAPLLWLVLPFMAGLAAGKIWGMPPIGCLAAALCAAAAALFAAGRAPRLWAAALGMAMLLAGDASYVLHRKRLPAWEGRPAREAKLSLRIDRVYPQAEIRKATGLATVVGAEAHLRDLTGQRIYYSFSLRKGQAPPGSARPSFPRPGLLLAVPPHPPANSFEGTLDSLGLNFQLTRARLVAEESPPTAYHRFCENLARRMNALLSAGLEPRPELAGVYRAMMLGRKKDLSPEQNLIFMRSGTLHLFAINGVHIGMMAASLHALLALLRVPADAPPARSCWGSLWLDRRHHRRQPGSAVRAFLMVAVLEAAFVLRRPGNPLAALTASALPVLLLDPMDFFSASFRMSYGVVAAILTLGLPLTAIIWCSGLSRVPGFAGSRRWSWRATSARRSAKAPVAGAGHRDRRRAGERDHREMRDISGCSRPRSDLAPTWCLVPLASLVLVSGLRLAGHRSRRRPGGPAVCSSIMRPGVLIRLIEAIIRARTRGCPARRGFRPAIGRNGSAPPGWHALAGRLPGGLCVWLAAEGEGWPGWLWLSPVGIVGIVLVFGVKFGT